VESCYILKNMKSGGIASSGAQRSGRKTRGPNQSMEQKRTLARVDFFDAGLYMPEECFDLLDPWYQLRSEIFPKWREVMASQPTEKTGRIRPFYHQGLGLNDDKIRKSATCTALLETWARDSWLVEQTNGQPCRPADWIVSRAQHCCELWDAPPTASPRIGEFLGYIGPFDGLLPPKFDVKGLIIPMDEPRQRSDESCLEFTKRARKAFNRHMKRLSVGNALEPTTPPAKPPLKPAPRNLNHFQWLILYQCCKWPLSKIRSRYPHVGTDQAIYMGLKEKAKLIGIALRRRRV
jgi:hypothetical protein